MINTYTIVTNNGHIHTNDDLLTASGIDIDDIIDGRYPLGPDVKLIMVIKNGVPVEVEVSGSGVSKISYITKTLDWKTSESIQNKDLPDELD